MKKSQTAVENFKTLNCAQSVLMSYTETIKLDKNTAMKIALGFGGGMTMGETCGAVTGAYMALGLNAKTEGKSLPEIKTEAKEAVRKFNEIFIRKHGSLKCKKLLGVNISTPEGAAVANGQNLFETICPELVASATDILEEHFFNFRRN